MNIKNTIYKKFYNKLYNPELKIEFIEDVYPDNESTKKTILNNFKKSAKSERKFDKDLCIMNMDEINDVAEGLGYITENTIQSALSFFSRYVDWCILNEKRGGYENNINDISIFMTTQNLSKFISRIKNKHRYLTKEEMYRAVDRAYNFVDKAILLGLYEGIAGKQLYELRSLKIEDINFDTNKVELIDVEENKRIITISDKLKYIFRYANSQSEYFIANGASRYAKKEEMAKSPYIIKSLNRKVNNNNEMVDRMSISLKIIRLKKYLGFGYDYITPQTIQDSGQINRVIELTKQHGLKEPTKAIFDILMLPEEYNLSEMQIYNLRQKFKIATNLKNFY
jgi:integrase